MIYPSVIDTMEFYSENHLACGSDRDYGLLYNYGILISQSLIFLDLQVTLTLLLLKSTPASNTLITGSGDGTIGLFYRHLTTCQWDLVVRYYCIEVGIRDCIV